MPSTIISYLIATPIFLIIDLLWIGLVAGPLFKKNVGHLLADKPNIPAAVLFYVIFTIGLVIFSIDPALKKNSVNYALIYGGLFGFFTYLAYDATNFATLKNWPFSIVIIDVLWGTFICALVSVLSFVLIRKFFI